MRTFLSHDATARCSDWGENEISDMPSSGGLLSATSFEMSPVVLFAADALEVGPLPKRPDIFQGLRRRGRNEKMDRSYKALQTMCYHERSNSSTSSPRPPV